MMQIAAAKRQIDRMIHKMQSTVGVDVTRSIVLSSLTREARRHHGLEGAQSLLQGLIDTVPEGDRPEVIVPPAALQLGPRERTVWVAAGMMIRTLQTEFGMGAAIGIILQSIHATKPILQGLIDTMPEAAMYDRE